MENFPLISIIVPVYKVEKYLERCVLSICKQTYKNLEIILVDDGSPDHCGELCEMLAKNDSRIRVIHKENGGLSDARNVALGEIKGDYVGFIDSDDWIAEDMFEYLLDGAVKNNAEIAICNYINAFKYQYSTDTTHYRDCVMEPDEALNELFTDHLENFACNKLFHASLWQDVRFPKGKNFEDILTIYKLVERATKIVLLKEPKYFYERRNDSISYNTKSYKNRKSIFEAVIGRYDDVVPRMPQYITPLFMRIRRYYCHELCKVIVNDPVNRDLFWDLLVMLTDFVKRERDRIYSSVDLSPLERKKFDAFAQCSLEGCKKALKYHELWIKKEYKEEDFI